MLGSVLNVLDFIEEAKSRVLHQKTAGKVLPLVELSTYVVEVECR
jgi:hypothetical protein